MMITTKKVARPRELKWYQAGAMLYGDWGTSKAYTLGIAFALAGHASWFFLGLMSLLTILVGFCYLIVCKIFPDGGGVYSSVKTRSQLLAVCASLLLVADYVVTVSLSALDAFHYFHVPNPQLWAIGSIVLIGIINWVGPTKSGSIATWIAVAATGAASILFISTIPNLPHVQLTMPEPNLPRNWSVFVGIVLALSGVEAVANMTGIMVEPVEKTSAKSIIPVMIEVSVITFLLGVAMNAIPNLTGHTEDMLRALANHYIGPWYGHVISLIFGLLLLSAVNTAITGLVSVQYLLAKDREMPSVFSDLNQYGMPWMSLVVAVAIPVLVLCMEADIVGLASLYAIGVVGAITMNLGACATNFKLKLNPWHRLTLAIAAVILLGVEITICFEKPNAFWFVMSILSIGLTLRFITKKILPAPAPALATESTVLTVDEAKELSALYKSTCLVALRGVNLSLLEEAVLRAKALGENAVYLDVVDSSIALRDLPDEIEPSKQSVEVLESAQKEIEKLGLVGIPVWQFGGDVGKQIARAARDLNIETVMIGASRRLGIVNLLRGSVIKTLAKNLPRDCHLLITG